MFTTIRILIIVIISPCFSIAQTIPFPIATKALNATIIYSDKEPKLDSISANLLADDIRRVTGRRPTVLTDLSKAKGNIIVIGSIKSAFVQRFISNESEEYRQLNGKWESFLFKTVNQAKLLNISRAFVIAGSDPRGTAYGVFTLSNKIGVSPWYWWADVPVKKKSEIILHQRDSISTEPSVKYRGIFINDEDWGLQPWAAKTFEPETGDIGPKTYSKVFELLLRLKANMIWPAMHPSTKAFYYFPQNKIVAENYSIIIGSSHAEPMLRNNVSEWDPKTMGAFNYLTNKEKVSRYWETRVRETSRNEVIYTLGMRGVHDSQMEGVKNIKEAIPVLEGIIDDQRQILTKYRDENVNEIPQVFTAYKEVLDIYDNGLKLPDDVTIVWPDDNYGYIHRLNDETESKRSGGSGVYYHASYWGRPHDYLWLSSTHPELIREEMMKAYENGSNRLWVLNVGDIKPLEYNIQFFLDIAYNAGPFKRSEYTFEHLNQWNQQIFGEKEAGRISLVMRKYYQLAFERRPEFMGWSQTEPTTPTNYTSFKHFYNGDEARDRTTLYSGLEFMLRMTRMNLDTGYDDAFYQLVYYPVICASLMNKKFLFQDKAMLYSKQNRKSAIDYRNWSLQAYDSIVKETEYYNNKLSGGKWKHMMSMKPRNLPVFQAPLFPGYTEPKNLTQEKWSIATEAVEANDTSYLSNSLKKTYQLPFDIRSDQIYFIDIFLTDTQTINWQATTSKPWIDLEKYKGVLSNLEGKKQERLYVRINWSGLPKSLPIHGSEGLPDFKEYIKFTGGGKEMKVELILFNQLDIDLQEYKGLLPTNEKTSIQVYKYSQIADKELKWERIEGLGRSGNSMQTSILKIKADTIGTNMMSIKERSSWMEYEFYSFSDAAANLSLYALPTHPLNRNYSVRLGVSVDDGPIKVVDFRTFGRSEEWKQNVLSNQAERNLELAKLAKGKHKLRVYAIDPGLVLDRMVINFR